MVLKCQKNKMQEFEVILPIKVILNEVNFNDSRQKINFYFENFI